jgi:RNA polymerase sigma-70 factor (ECF subfamily)
MAGVGRRRDGVDLDSELAPWVAAARAGDIDSFGNIWRLLSGRVHGYVRARGVDNPDDVTSEVFLAAFTGIARFDGGPAEFRSWLFTIAHHKAVDEHRRRREDASYEPEADPRVVASAEAAALESVLEEDTRAMLDALTSEQREVLLLRALGDLSVEQVAEVTGRSVGAVKQLHHRAVATAQRSAAASHRGAWRHLPGQRTGTRKSGNSVQAVTPSPAPAMTET